MSEEFIDENGDLMKRDIISSSENKKELKPANQNPEFGKVCKHGSLKRSCYICELEEQVERLEVENKLITENLEKAIYHGYKELAVLKDQLEKGTSESLEIEIAHSERLEKELATEKAKWTEGRNEFKRSKNRH